MEPQISAILLCHAVDVAYLGLGGKQDGGYTYTCRLNAIMGLMHYYSRINKISGPGVMGVI